MSYPEFRLRPSPEAWMNGLILSPPPFSLWLSSPLSSSPPASIPHLFQTFSPSLLSKSLHCVFSPLPPWFFYSFISLCLMHNSIHYPSSPLNYMKVPPPQPCLVRGLLVLFLIPTFTRDSFPLHQAPLSFFIILYFCCLFPLPPIGVFRRKQISACRDLHKFNCRSIFAVLIYLSKQLLYQLSSSCFLFLSSFLLSFLCKRIIIVYINGNVCLSLNIQMFALGLGNIFQNISNIFQYQLMINIADDLLVVFKLFIVHICNLFLDSFI